MGAHLSPLFDFCAGNRHQIVAGARVKAVKVTPKLLVARVAFMQVWHKLHVMLWFGAFAGGIR